jgi:hypothetical protein
MISRISAYLERPILKRPIGVKDFTDRGLEHFIDKEVMGRLYKPVDIVTTAVVRSRYYNVVVLSELLARFK